MSRDLHPHWQEEPGAQPVRISVKSPAKQEETSCAPAVSVSRRPAAFAGVAVVLGLLTSVYGTAGLFSGQVPQGSNGVDTGIVVRITDVGFDPPSINVKPGDTVTWQNESAIPHILSSETIETVDGPLDTSPIFPESSLAVTLKKTAKAGTHTYISQTSDLSGKLTIDANASSSQKQSAAAVRSSAPQTTTAQQSTSQSSSAVVEQSSPVAALPVSSAQAKQKASKPQQPSSREVAVPQDIPVIPTAAVGTIPRNPYAINKPSYVDPVTTQPTVSSSSSLKHAGAPKDTASVTTHKPKVQPGSGPGDWIVALSTGLALIMLGMHASRRKAWTSPE